MKGSTTPRRIVISANPKAGRGRAGRAVQQLVARLAALGYDAAVVDRLDAAAEEANRLFHAGDLHALVAAGGDGTIAGLVNLTPAEMPLTILPLGTENLLARYVGLDGSPESTAQIIDANQTWQFDAGLANDRVFLLMASCGFDAEVVHSFHARRRGPIRRWHYARPIWQMIRSYQYPPIRLYCDGRAEPDEFVARWLFLFNLPCYAVRLRIAPQASGTDGRLDYCAFRDGSVRSGLRYLSHVVARNHHTLTDCQMGTFRTMTIESDAPIAYQIDGDPGGQLPLRVSVLEKRLRLIVPSAFVAAQQRVLKDAAGEGVPPGA